MVRLSELMGFVMEGEIFYGLVIDLLYGIILVLFGGKIDIVKVCILIV